LSGGPGEPIRHERICIVGCGAIGGLYAVHLAQLDELEVWAYDVCERHVHAINRDGLRLTGATELVGRVRASTDPDAIPPCRFGIVATKGMFTEGAIAATAALFTGGAVCSVQNGIGNEELIAGHVGRVMRGVTLPAVRLAAPGVIEVIGAGPTWIGPFEPRPAAMADVDRLAELMNRSGLPTHGLADARGPQWTKLLFNCATNPLCALTGLTHGQLIDHPAMRRLVAGLIAEGRAVAGALGITLDGDPDVLVDTAGRANYHHRPSMLQDVDARRPTEIATLNGGVVEAGHRCGVDVSLNQTICELIDGLQRSWMDAPQKIDGAGAA
jgi:2-dehydropantoate 2-reductase